MTNNRDNLKKIVASLFFLGIAISFGWYGANQAGMNFFNPNTLFTVHPDLAQVTTLFFFMLFGLVFAIGGLAIISDAL